MRLMFSALPRALCAILLAGACLPGLAAAQALDARRDVIALGGVSSGAAELYVRRIERPVLGALQPAYGLSVTTQGQLWLGGGLAYALPLSPGGLFLRGSIMPGVHLRGRGRDLGGPVVFRSGLELGMPLGAGEVTLGVDHRSNAGLYSNNPGLNALYLSYTFRVN